MNTLKSITRFFALLHQCTGLLRKEYGDVIEIEQECEGPKFLSFWKVSKVTSKEYKTSKDKSFCLHSKHITTDGM